jgi:hypothetical protein
MKNKVCVVEMHTIQGYHHRTLILFGSCYYVNFTFIPSTFYWFFFFFFAKQKYYLNVSGG